MDERLIMTVSDNDYAMFVMVLDTSGAVQRAYEAGTGERAISQIPAPDGGAIITSMDWPWYPGMDLQFARLDTSFDWTCPVTDIVVSAETFTFSVVDHTLTVPVTVVPVDRTSAFSDSSATVSTYVPCSSLAIPREPADHFPQYVQYDAATGRAVIHATDMDEVEMIDASGRTILTRSASEDDLEIDLHAIPTGLYVVRMIKGDHCWTEKLLKR
jgi:hypothetical protein